MRKLDIKLNISKIERINIAKDCCDALFYKATFTTEVNSDYNIFRAIPIGNDEAPFYKFSLGRIIDNQFQELLEWIDHGAKSVKDQADSEHSITLSLSINNYKRIDKKSSYNDNYYKIDFDKDLVDSKANIIHEVCYEDEYFYFELGHIENNKFYKDFSWIDYNEDEIEGVIQ